MADNLNQPKGNGDQAPRVLGPDDVQAMIQVVLTKDGQVLLNYPPDNLPLTLQLLSDGVKIAAGLVAQKMGQEPRRIVPVTGLPPGVNLRGGG